MKIAFVAASSRIGGAERALLDLLASLRSAEPGAPLHLVVPGHGPLASAAAALGVTVHPLPFPRAVETVGDAGAAGSRASLGLRLVGAIPAGTSYLRRLRRLLGAIAPDVVHTNGLKPHAAAALALRRGTPLVWHLHDYAGTRAVMARVLRRLARRASAAIAVSRSVAADARAVCGGGLRVEVVHNAVDLARFAPAGDRAPLHALAGMAPEEPGTVTVGLVATMGVWKGHEVFLRALSFLPRDLPVRGYVVGGPIYATARSEVDPARLRELAAALGVADRVGFTGFVDDTPAAMRALDVVVHASTRPEPFGLVIAEAMACGRPVVYSAAGGAAEAAGDVGVSAAPGSPAALADAIRRLAEDPALRARLGVEGRAAAVRDFDRARLGPAVARIYRSLRPAG